MEPKWVVILAAVLLVVILELYNLFADRCGAALRRYLRRALWPLLGMWLLLHPPNDFQESWVIMGSAPTRWDCEQKRAVHPLGKYLVCAEAV